MCGLRSLPMIIDVPFLACDLDLPCINERPLINCGQYSFCLSFVSVYARMDLSPTEFAKLISLVGTLRPCTLSVERVNRFFILGLSV